MGKKNCKKIANSARGTLDCMDNYTILVLFVHTYLVEFVYDFLIHRSTMMAHTHFD